MNKTYLFFVGLSFVIIAVTIIIINNIFVDATGTIGQSLFLHLVNSILFALSLIAFIMHKKALNAKTNFEFTSKTISVSAIKMAAIVVLIVSYIIFSKTSIHLMSLLSAMLFYFLYNFLEIFFLLKEVRKNKSQSVSQTNN